MKLVNSLYMITRAKEEGIAIPAFNVHNLETIQGVIEGAALMKSPVIIQTTPGTLKHAGVEYVSSIVKKAAELHSIPIALHVDHCKSFEMIEACIKNGYSSVMIDGSHLPYDENVALVKRVVVLAKEHNVQVEGEIGKIVGVEDELFVSENEGAFTSPEEAVKFSIDTKVDTLAVAIGTAHGIYKGEPKLDFDRIEKISQLVACPLVLHGASGVPDESVKRAIRLGMAKVNIATELKIPMAEAIYNCIALENTDPRKYMGAGREAVKAVVMRKIEVCGSANFASQL